MSSPNKTNKTIKLATRMIHVAWRMRMCECIWMRVFFFVGGTEEVTTVPFFYFLNYMVTLMYAYRWVGTQRVHIVGYTAISHKFKKNRK